MPSSGNVRDSALVRISVRRSLPGYEPSDVLDWRETDKAFPTKEAIMESLQRQFAVALVSALALAGCAQKPAEEST